MQLYSTKEEQKFHRKLAYLKLYYDWPGFCVITILWLRPWEDGGGCHGERVQSLLHFETEKKKEHEKQERKQMYEKLIPVITRTAAKRNRTLLVAASEHILKTLYEHSFLFFFYTTFAYRLKNGPCPCCTKGKLLFSLKGVSVCIWMTFSLKEKLFLFNTLQYFVVHIVFI